jgi:hypothetical protein
MALAGLIVSGGMSLLAIWAMMVLAWDWFGPDDTIRAIFYLLIFPTAFYMAQVYSEATYMAVSLGALVFLSTDVDSCSNSDRAGDAHAHDGRAAGDPVLVHVVQRMVGRQTSAALGIDWRGRAAAGFSRLDGLSSFT